MGKIVLLFPLLLSSLSAVSIFETIFDGNCKSCHNLKDEDSAPFIDKIVQKYKLEYPAKKDFIFHLSNYVYYPKIKKSLFPKAIKHYGIMPQLSIDKDTLRGIALYLYKRKFKQTAP